MQQRFLAENHLDVRRARRYGTPTDLHVLWLRPKFLFTLSRVHDTQTDRQSG